MKHTAILTDETNAYRSRMESGRVWLQYEIHAAELEATIERYRIRNEALASALAEAREHLRMSLRDVPVGVD